MNPYFWLFAVCALLMTPITANISVRFSHGVRYRFRLQAAGLPFLQKKEENHPEEEEVDARDAVRGALSPELPVLISLWRGGDIQRALRSLQLEAVYLRAHLSFSDAAATAVAYAFVRTVAQTLALCARDSARVQGRVEANFREDGSELFVRCIVSARLGSLGAAAIRLGMAVKRARAKLSTAEEENHAEAASH